MVDDDAKRLLARNTDAVIQQSVVGERVAGALERLEIRLATPPAQAALSRNSVALLLALVALAALAGSFAGAVAGGGDKQQRRTQVAAARTL
jgi:hypothetical protein